MKKNIFDEFTVENRFFLEINYFTFNAFEENTYIIANDKKQCWIIDPGMYQQDEKDAVFEFIANKQLQPQGIINTHAHIDHIFGVQALMDKYNIPFSMHELETEVLKMAAGSATLFGFDFRSVPKPTSFIKAGEPLQLGDDTLEVFHTPGHSPGSISFYYPKGNWVISGYFKNEGGKVVDEEGWFGTGDVATIDPDGYVQLTDRLKDVIKSGGEWISSIEIENLAVSHPDVFEAAVIAIEHPVWQERPLLIVQPKPGHVPSKQSILDFLSDKIAKWWMPDDVVFVDSLPHTATGKLLKTELRAKYHGHLAVQG